jgi:four helix bundle protein
MKITRFEEIEGWQLARELTPKVYSLASKEKFSRDFGLRDQIQRASGSSMHNVAEGFDSGSNAEFVRFLRYAQRSCTEVQSQLYVALDQKYLSSQEFDDVFSIADLTKSRIGGLIKYLLNNEKQSPSSDKETRTKN